MLKWSKLDIQSAESVFMWMEGWVVVARQQGRLRTDVLRRIISAGEGRLIGSWANYHQRGLVHVGLGKARLLGNTYYVVFPARVSHRLQYLAIIRRCLSRDNGQRVAFKILNSPFFASCH